MATVVCAHSTAILTNHGPYKLVEERIFYVAGAVHGVLIKGDVLISGVSLKRDSKI